MSIEILDKALLKSLLNEDIPFHEVMNAYNVKTSVAFNMPASVLGFVYLSRRNNYHLILNGNVSYETQCHTFVHEIKHIVSDMPEMGYIIGVDMHRTYIERDADEMTLDLKYIYVK
ncbi:hypothetical protein [Clostridium sp. DJ247]|uniref:hypothetical protein n=1 Tax=Clostridium sp. DJ247 TaxID=2726188 RepID=UPI001A9AE3B8|nr:hypothetical protein [Clostridium sp. DJ247]MBC2580590.1 hypothetical protein [Clostridium sp. DJ247]